jgi:hypothetical protein
MRTPNYQKITLVTNFRHAYILLPPELLLRHQKKKKNPKYFIALLKPHDISNLTLHQFGPRFTTALVPMSRNTSHTPMLDVD